MCVCVYVYIYIYMYVCVTCYEKKLRKSFIHNVCEQDHQNHNEIIASQEIRECNLRKGCATDCFV